MDILHAPVTYRPRASAKDSWTALGYCCYVVIITLVLLLQVSPTESTPTGHHTTPSVEMTTDSMNVSTQAIFYPTGGGMTSTGRTSEGATTKQKLSLTTPGQTVGTTPGSTAGRSLRTTMTSEGMTTVTDSPTNTPERSPSPIRLQSTAVLTGSGVTTQTSGSPGQPLTTTGQLKTSGMMTTGQPKTSGMMTTGQPKTSGMMTTGQPRTSGRMTTSTDQTSAVIAQTTSTAFFSTTDNPATTEQTNNTRSAIVTTAGKTFGTTGKTQSTPLGSTNYALTTAAQTSAMTKQTSTSQTRTGTTPSSFPTDMMNSTTETLGTINSTFSTTMAATTTGANVGTTGIKPNSSPSSSLQTSTSIPVYSSGTTPNVTEEITPQVTTMAATTTGVNLATTEQKSSTDANTNTPVTGPLLLTTVSPTEETSASGLPTSQTPGQTSPTNQHSGQPNSSPSSSLQTSTAIPVHSSGTTPNVTGEITPSPSPGRTTQSRTKQISSTFEQTTIAESPPGSLNVTLIVGVCVGAFGVFITVLVFLLVIRRKKTKRGMSRYYSYGYLTGESTEEDPWPTFSNPLFQSAAESSPDCP